MASIDVDGAKQVFKGCTFLDDGIDTAGTDSDPDFEGDSPPPTDSDSDYGTDSESEFPFPVGTNLLFRGEDILHRDGLDSNFVYEAEIICIYDRDFCQVKFWDGATDDMHADEVIDAELLHAHSKAPLPVGTKLAFHDRDFSSDEGEICRVNDSDRFLLYEVELADGNRLDMCVTDVIRAAQLYTRKFAE